MMPSPALSTYDPLLTPRVRRQNFTLLTACPSVLGVHPCYPAESDTAFAVALLQLAVPPLVPRVGTRWHSPVRSTQG
jgi:hypothetical protein